MHSLHATGRPHGAEGAAIRRTRISSDGLLWGQWGNSQRMPKVLDLSCGRFYGSGVVYYHIGRPPFAFQRFLGSLTTSKILLGPSSRLARCEPLSRSIDKNDLVAKSVPTRLEQQRHVHHDRRRRALLADFLHLANGQLPDCADESIASKYFSSRGPAAAVRTRSRAKAARSIRPSALKIPSPQRSRTLAFNFHILQNIVGQVVGRNHCRPHVPKLPETRLLPLATPPAIPINGILSPSTTLVRANDCCSLVPRLAVGPIVSRFQVDFQRHVELHHARHFVAHQVAPIASSSSGGTSKINSSWICSNIRAADRSVRSRRWMAIMASLIRSAAEPWMTVLIAVRSGRFRWRGRAATNAADRAPPTEDGTNIPSSGTFFQYPVAEIPRRPDSARNRRR